MSRLLAPRIGAGEEDRGRRFGRQREDLDAPSGQAVQRLARGELGVEMDDGLAAFGLRQHDRVRAAGNDRVEIGVGQAGVERVDAHEEARARRARRVVLQKGQRRLPRARLALGRDRILEVEDQRVGAACRSLVELLRAVGRNEEEGTHQAVGRFSMKACRLHSATSLPS